MGKFRDDDEPSDKDNTMIIIDQHHHQNIKKDDHLSKNNTKQFNINNLPKDLLGEIQSFIHDEWLNFRLVCKKWSNIYCDYLYIKLKIKDYNDIKHLCNSKLLQHAHELYISNFTEQEYEIMNQNNELFKNIKKLYLYGNLNLKMVENLFLNSNSFIYNLNDLYIETIEIKQLNEIYEKGIKIAEQFNYITILGLLKYLIFSTNMNIEYLKTALELNNIQAIKYMINSSEDPTEWLEKGSKLGNLKIQLDLAISNYEDGDPFIAFELFEKVFNSLKNVEKNNKEINLKDFSHYLGQYYFFGNFIETNYEKALYYFFKCDQNDQKVKELIIGCYTKMKDYKNCYKWNLKLAENSKDSNSQSMLAWQYEYGIGVEQDYTSAFKWYLKASNNDPLASFTISHFYCNGIGILPNMEESINYLVKSYKYSSSILQFLIDFKLLNHLQNLNEIQKLIHYKPNNGNNLEMVKSTCHCNLCETFCNGFYYSTSDAFSVDLCKECYNEETLEAFELELENRNLIETHILVKFIPLLEYCKECNHINNEKLDNIINQLKGCQTIH